MRLTKLADRIVARQLGLGSEELMMRVVLLVMSLFLLGLAGCDKNIREARAPWHVAR